MPSATYSRPSKCQINHAERQQQAHKANKEKSTALIRPNRPAKLGPPFFPQPHEARISEQSFPFTSLPFDIRHHIYAIMFVSPKDIVVKNYSLSGVRRSQYKVEPGTELLHRSYSNYQVWKEASEVYYGENTFLMTPFTVSHFLEATEATGTFPIHEVHHPRNLIRNIKLTLGNLGNVGFVMALRHLKILLTCPKLENLSVHICVSLIPFSPLSQFFASGCLSLIVCALRKLKAHVGNNMILTTSSDSGAVPFEAKYVGCDSVRLAENMTWLLDIPSEQIIEKVTKGQGSLRECLTVEMASRWAPPVEEGPAKGGDDASPPE